MKNEYWQPSTIVGAQHEYGKLANVVGPDQASALLQSQGIPGIRYLDGGSRGAGTGTSNFVVFGDGKMLKILGWSDPIPELVAFRRGVGGLPAVRLP